jgi:hypothetical protein
MSPFPAIPPTPRRTSGRRASNSTPPRASILIAEALFGDKPIKRRKSNDAVEDKAATLAELLRDKSKPKRQTVDFARAFGGPAPNSVQDRVRKWQSQGGGVVNQRKPVAFPPEATPVVSEDSTDQEVDENGGPFRFNGPMKTRTRKDAKIKAREEAKRAEEEAKMAGEEARAAAEEAKAKSSPKKRVLSDGNWRKRHAMAGDGRSGMGQKKYGSSSPPPNGEDIRGSPAKDDFISRRERRRAEAEQSIPDDGIRIKPSREHSDVHRERRREGQRTPSKQYPDSDGIRVSSTPRQSSTRLRSRQSGDDLRRSSGSRQGDSSYVDRPSSRTTFSPGNSRSGGSKESTPKQWSPTSAAALNSRKYVEDTVKRRRRSTSRDKTPDHTDTPTRKFSPRYAPKTNILREVYDEGKKIFAKAPERPPDNRTGNRIEAWLSETPDPFTDDPPDSVVGAARPDPEAGFYIPPIKEEVVHEDRAPYPDLSRTERSEKNSGSWTGSGRRRRRVRSFGVTDGERTPDGRESLPSYRTKTVERERQASPNVVEDAPSLTPPSLKRTGAKRSSPTGARRKSSPLKDFIPEEESIASSTPNPSSIGMSEPPPDSMPEVFTRRAFPQTGRHRLSTIASVETFDTRVQFEAVSAVSQDTIQGNSRQEDAQTSESGGTFDPDNPLFPGKRTSLKRRLTTHADLISVLSLPKAGNQSIQSARSIRTNRSKLATATVEDLMKELSTDEMKYMRELRTLVDGVIPVLLTCVLSKSDSAVAAGLFNRTPSGSEDPSITRPIVDMGVALERLKALHKRIPLQDPDRLLTWAQSAQKMYTDYLKAWRMGFQDVVVNLAPASDSTFADKEQTRNVEEQSLYEGLPRNTEGDVVNGDGERVDVAFLLKRPLVRLKFLAKTFKVISFYM